MIPLPRQHAFQVIVAFLGALMAGCASVPSRAPGDWGRPAPTGQQEVESSGTQQLIPMPELPKESKPAKEGETGKPSESAEEKEKEKELKPKFEVRGRINADVALVNQSAKDKAIIGDIDNGVGFRRARLGVQGTIGEQVRWVSEFDFAGGTITFKDVYLAIEELPIIRQVRVGHFVEPFSLEGEMSANALTFIERSPAYALDPDRNWGVGIFAYTENERATFACGAFRSGTDDSGNDIGDSNDMAYTGRVTALPWYDAASDGCYLMHIGAAFSQRYPKNDVVTFKQSPQSSLLQVGDDDTLTPFVPNISIPATQNQLYNLQWAAVLGSLSFQAEWYGTTIDQIGGGEVFLHGSYVYASYFLTGEHRQYNRKEGDFERTHVLAPFLCLRGKRHLGSAPGGWEIAARFAYLDFSDPNIPLTPQGLKQGNRLAESTFGINWYLNDYARIMFNYTHAVPVDPNFGPSYANGYLIRSEVVW